MFVNISIVVQVTQIGDVFGPWTTYKIVFDARQILAVLPILMNSRENS